MVPQNRVLPTLNGYLTFSLYYLCMLSTTSIPIPGLPVSSVFVIIYQWKLFLK